MPDQSNAADEHALLSEITQPLSHVPGEELEPSSEVDFPVVLRGYDRFAVDAYVKQVNRRIADLQSAHEPDAAVRRALERVGEDVSGILQRAHSTAERITATSRREAEDRLELSRREAAQTTAAAERRLAEIDAETDRIWSERMRIVEDARELARQLLSLADAAAERFPPAPAEDDVETGEIDPALRAAMGVGSGAAALEDDEAAPPEAPADREEVTEVFSPPPVRGEEFEAEGPAGSAEPDGGQSPFQ